ncbi:MAG: hypothetical protein HQL74_01685 [Magnetococcales bacterium]|nr:hypothetical protein [Magnetococcales bacterium]
MFSSVNLAHKTNLEMRNSWRQEHRPLLSGYFYGCVFGGNRSFCAGIVAQMGEKSQCRAATIVLG